MRGLLWVLALFALAVGISLAMHVNDGYVLLVMPPYRAEISLNLAMLLVLLAFAVLYAFLRAAALTLSLPRRVRAFRERREREKSQEAFADAVLLLFEGNFNESLKKAAEAYASDYLPARAALVAARAAQSLGEGEKLKEWLERAVQKDPRVQQARLLFEAETLVETGKFADALEVLRHLQNSSGSYIAAMRLELRAQQGLGNREEMLRIAGRLENQKALPAELAREIGRRVDDNGTFV